MLTRNRIESYLRRIAALAALTVTIAPAVAYYLIATQHVAGKLEIEAQAKAALVSAYVARNPDGWRYQPERLQEALLPAVASHHDTVVEDTKGATLARFGATDRADGPGSAYVISRRSPFFDFGDVVGQVGVQAPLRDIFGYTALIGLIGALLGALIFVPMWRMPLLALRRATHELQISEKQHRQLVDALSDGVLMIDRRLTVLQSNPAVARILGVDAEKLDGRPLVELIGGLLDENEQDISAEDFFRQAIADGGELPARTMIVVRGDRSRRFVRLSAHNVDDELAVDGGIKAIAVSLTDISDRVAAEKHIRFLASTDALTSLPNRNSLIDHLDEQVSRARRHHEQLGVLFVDLDHFKDINDSLGHDAGDQVLLAVAARLRGTLRQEDFISRVGGDEFVVVVPDTRGPSAVTTVAAKLLGSLSEPYEIAGQPLALTPSIGIATYPGDGETAETLLANADVAMYAAKQNGRSNFLFYAVTMNEAAHRRLEMTGAIRHGLEAGEFMLYFQPKVLARTGEAVGAEALLRWKHPQRGFVSPAEFIPVAEESRLIVDIGRWVLAEANRLTLEWQARGLPCPPVAINVSAMQFRQSEFLDLLREIGPEGARRIDLEITESVMLETPEAVIQHMDAIKAMGFSLSLDDFGTGYSSLSYLTRFPLKYLKIDQSFVRRMASDAPARAIIEAIIRLAQAVGLEVIAEGVETEVEANLLRMLNCDQFQGYHFARPMPAADYLAWLAERTRSAPAVVPARVLAGLT